MYDDLMYILIYMLCDRWWIMWLCELCRNFILFFLHLYNAPIVSLYIQTVSFPYLFKAHIYIPFTIQKRK